MPKTTFIRGGVTPYDVRADFTCLTAKRALLLAGLGVLFALAALIHSAAAARR